MSKPPQAVSEAMAVIIQFVLAQGLEVDSRGAFITGDDFTINGVPFGNWRIDIRRTKKP